MIKKVITWYLVGVLSVTISKKSNAQSWMLYAMIMSVNTSTTKNVCTVILMKKGGQLNVYVEKTSRLLE